MAKVYRTGVARPRDTSSVVVVVAYVIAALAVCSMVLEVIAWIWCVTAMAPAWVEIGREAARDVRMMREADEHAR